MTNNDAPIRVLIVDDEPPARRRLERWLRRDSSLEMVGNCASAAEALAIIAEQMPDIIFLDIQMPRVDGFALLEQLDATPLVVFVTAYDQYAVRAFEVSAFDYLLKPYDEERFAQVLQRAKQQLQLQRQQPLLLRQSPPKFLRKLVIKTPQKVFLLNTEDIDWIKAEGKYVRLYAGQASYLWRGAISDLEAQLEAATFIRIHRSTIINLERVKELHPLFHGEYEVILRDGTQLTLSRRYRAHLQQAIGDSL